MRLALPLPASERRAVAAPAAPSQALGSPRGSGWRSLPPSPANAAAGGTCPPWMSLGLRPPLLGPLGVDPWLRPCGSYLPRPGTPGSGGGSRISGLAKGLSPSTGPAARVPPGAVPSLSSRSSWFLERLDSYLGHFLSLPWCQPCSSPLSLPPHFRTPLLCPPPLVKSKKVSKQPL